MATSATKRRKLGPDQEFEEITSAEYEDDLSNILARIREQEESEAFAKQLEAEWNDVPSTGTRANGIEKDVIVIPDDEEDDEEMARRLAREWDEQDSKNRPSQSTSSSSSKSRLDTPARRPSTGSLSAIELNVPPDEKLRKHQSLFTVERNCPKCNKKVESPRGMVCRLRRSLPHVFYIILGDFLRKCTTSDAPVRSSFSPNLPKLILLILSTLLHAPCRACKINYCRGCFSKVSCPTFCMGKDKTCAVRSCCAESRAIAIFEALGGLDRQYIKERVTTDSRVKAAVKKNKNNRSMSHSVGPGGTGYGTEHGHTSLGSMRGKRKLKDISVADVDAPVSGWDKTLVAGLTTLTALLPEPYAENAHVYDMLPHASIGHLISLS
jgi:hypothetical protein